MSGRSSSTRQHPHISMTELAFEYGAYAAAAGLRPMGLAHPLCKPKPLHRVPEQERRLVIQGDFVPVLLGGQEGLCRRVGERRVLEAALVRLGARPACRLHPPGQLARRTAPVTTPEVLGQQAGQHGHRELVVLQ